MAGRVLRMETVRAAHGSYTGAQCPDCEVVVQPMYYGAGQGRSSLAEAMAEHRRLCHPERER